MADPTLLTVILNYRTAEMTLKSLAAAHREMQDIDGEIVVVDNDSKDGSFAKITAAIRINGWETDNRVRLVRTGHNGGFGAGNNFAIRAGLSGGQKPDFVFVLNSDAFPEKDAITHLLERLQSNPELGMAGSQILDPDTSTHLTAFRFPSIWGELEGAARTGPISRLLRDYVVAMPVPEASQKVDWLAGASLMIRQEMLDHIGLFDETFFLYFEETDLCLRAKRAGWLTYYQKESHVTHVGGVSTGMRNWQRVPEYWLDSRHYYFTKNHGVAYAAVATIAHLIGGSLWWLRRRLQGKPHIDPPRFLTDLMRHSWAKVKSDFKRRKPNASGTKTTESNPGKPARRQT
ncbi:MAG: N-acetylglucosaminyl-diphospho-decaprenol L-rhamnosyltransferase [Candidatus Paceibacteria bacterium]|jgi:N-acetylglucosaminyl-diphospho-decaprenol L-rhamnosyltransferase